MATPTPTGFGNSKKKKKKKVKAKGSGTEAGAGGSTGKGSVRKDGEEGVAWRAEAEATVLWWWETDEDARVPWAVARLLGLLLR